MTENPYQPPAADLQPPPPTGPSVEHPQRVAAGRGVAWFGEGWSLFMSAAGPLIAIAVVMYALLLVGGIIPLLGTLAVTLFWPHLMAGYYLALEHAHQRQPVAVGDLFVPFNDPMNLLGLGLFYLVGTVVLMAVVLLFMLGGLGLAGLETVLSGQSSGTGELQLQGLVVSMLLGLLVMFALLVPFMMAFIFSPLLVHQHDIPPVDAIKLSFQACLRNFMPFLLWGLVWLAAFVVAVIIGIIPILGWLLFIAFLFLVTPLSLASLYVAYRDIFLEA